MAPKKQNDIDWGDQSIMIPLLLMLVGVVVLMINLGFASAEWVAYWPILLIVIGLWKIMDRT